jgi:hypothetical protein
LMRPQNSPLPGVCDVTQSGQCEVFELPDPALTSLRR